MSENLFINAQGRALYLTLNRANKHNAFDDTLLLALKRALLAANQDESINIIVLNAYGETFFCGCRFGLDATHGQHE